MVFVILTVMTWSQRRKLTYTGIVVLFLAIIVAALVGRFTNVEPTCFDYKKNGSEVGVDCGGQCTLYCQNELSVPKVRWYRSFVIAPGIVHAVAYIEHSNSAAAARSAAYEFKIYDEKNNLITTRAGTTYIGPFGRTAIVEALIPVGNSVPYFTRFAFTAPIPWEKVGQVFSQVVIKSDRQLLENIANGTRLTVTLENQSNFSFDNMDVVAILYDNEDNAIAVSKTLIPELSAKQKKTVYFTWPQSYKESTARIEIIPRINPFDSQQL